MSAYEQLLNEISSMSVIDTHEHLDSEEYRVTSKQDIFTVFMSHYVSSDIISSGMPPKEMDILRKPNVDLDLKWETFEPYWGFVQNTTYTRAMSIAIRDLYGIEELSRSTYRELDKRIKNTNNKGLYKSILKDKCRIETSILNMLAEPRCGRSDYLAKFERLDSLDADFFLPVISFDEFIKVTDNIFIKLVESYRNTTITDLNGWLKQLEYEILECKKKGIIGIKCALAYCRILEFDEVDIKVAERLFEQILKADTPQISWNQLKPLQDYIMHKVLQYAGENNLPVQIHTGLQEGNGNIITNSNPVHLANLFIKYPRVKFDIFHGGYPYGSELSTLAKNFQNVFIDMCWLHVISSEYSVRLLGEWLDTVPSNKIFGFGGDYIFVEGVYGHMQIAKDNIARTLAHKVESRQLTMKQCVDISKRILRDNALTFFRID